MSEKDRWQRKKPNRTKDVVLLGIAGLCIALTVWFVFFRDRGQQPENPQAQAPAFAYRVLRMQSPESESSEPSPIQINEQALLAAIHASADYLANAIQPNGQFAYRINLDPEAHVAERYNILRHAGTIYSLAAYQAEHPSDKVADTLLKSSEFLHTQIGEVERVPGALAVWSDPEVNNSGAVKQCKLGGNGLALVGLCSVENVLPETTKLETLHGLAELILHLQKPDGSFYSKYIPANGGRMDSWTSLYYPGEAALGLVMLYERDANPRWRDAAANALLYLASSRENEDQVPADHWAMIATSRLLALPETGLAAEQRQSLIGHARRVCGELAFATDPIAIDPRLDGCLTGDGRTTPTATRMEGLLASLQGELLLDSTGDLTRELAGRSISFLLRAQIPRGPAKGGMPRAFAWAPPDHPWAEDADFNRRAPEIRIDYVQHALSAMLIYHELEFTSDELVGTSQ